MHLEDKIYNGIVDEYDLDHNFAVVIIIASLDVNVALKHVVEILPHGEVLALGRAISGKLKATNVILAGDSSGYEDEDPTCKNLGGTLVLRCKHFGLFLLLYTQTCTKDLFHATHVIQL